MGSDFFASVGLPFSNLKNSPIRNAPVWSPTNGNPKPAVNFLSSVSGYQSHLYRHNKTLQRNNNILPDYYTTRPLPDYNECIPVSE